MEVGDTLSGCVLESIYGKGSTSEWVCLQCCGANLLNGEQLRVGVKAVYELNCSSVTSQVLAF